MELANMIYQVTCKVEMHLTILQGVALPLCLLVFNSINSCYNHHKP